MIRNYIPDSTGGSGRFLNNILDTQSEEHGFYRIYAGSAEIEAWFLYKNREERRKVSIDNPAVFLPV